MYSRATRYELDPVAVLVQLDLRHGSGELVLGQAQAEALGEHRHPEGTAVGDPLEHRGLDDVHQARQPEGLVAAELLGDHRQGGPGRLPDAQGQVVGRAAHGHHQEPPLRRKSSIRVSCLAAGVLLSLVATACGSSGSASSGDGSSAGSGSKLIVIFIPPTSDPYAATWLNYATNEAPGGGAARGSGRVGGAAAEVSR
jgi:hypothetical protein